MMLSIVIHQQNSKFAWKITEKSQNLLFERGLQFKFAAMRQTPSGNPPHEKLTIKQIHQNMYDGQCVEQRQHDCTQLTVCGELKWCISDKLTSNTSNWQ